LRTRAGTIYKTFTESQHLVSPLNPNMEQAEANTPAINVESKGKEY